MRFLVTDSGIGGLNVLRSLRLRYDRIDFYYLSDRANAPYGEKSKSFLLSRTESILDEFGRGMDGVVFACNTQTVTCLDKLKDKYPFPIFGVRPDPPKGRSLILCTQRTAESDWIKNVCKGLPADVAAPRGLVCAIEKNVRAVIAGDYGDVISYLPPDRGYDEVALGCTHFLFLLPLVKDLYPSARVCGVPETLFGAIDGKFGVTRGNVTHKISGKNKNNITFLGDDCRRNCAIFSLLDNK